MQQQLEIIVSFRKGGQDALPQIQTGAKTVMNSIDGLNAKMKYYESIAKKADIGSREYANALKQVELAQKQASTAQLRANQNMQGTTRQTAQMTMTMQAMNFTIRDSPYFFRDFSLGILAIGNNLNPLIDGLINVKREAKLAGSSLGKELMKSLKGPGGVIFMFSVLVSVMQAVVFAMAKTKDKTKETNDELKKLSETLKDLTDTKLLEIKVKNLTEIRQIIAEAKKVKADEIKKALEDTTTGMKAIRLEQMDAESFLTDEQREQLRLLRLQNGEIAVLRGGHTSLRKIANEIKALQDEAKEATAERAKVINEVEIPALENLKKLFGENTKVTKDAKEKQYILTEQQIRAEMAVLEILKAQSASVLDRFHYTQQIESLKYGLGEMGRLPDPSEGLGYTPYTAPGKLQGVGRI